jgi:hypothetical protein
MSAFPPIRVSLASLNKVECRAELYRRFLPTWPALAEAFEREAARIAAALKDKRK